MDATCKSNFGRNELALYRYQRYQQSLATNPNFYFGPLALLLFGASSFLYELMPSGPNYTPDLPTISSFFGATKNPDGSFSFNGNERIPDNWYNRLTPYTNNDVTNEILAQYLLHPVMFGGNTGNGGFDGISYGGAGGIVNGKLVKPDAATVLCLLYQAATGSVPSSLNGVITPTVQAVAFAASKLNPLFANLGCPLALT